MEWYLKVLRQYADFNGRARRKEFWMYYLITCMLMIGLTMVGGIIAIVTDTPALMMGVLVIIILYYVATLIPTLAVIVRRLHDTNNSGWMYCVTFIPMVGGIWLIVLLCTDGTLGENQYGPDPKLEQY